jgi:hypothetical protein
VVFCGAKLTIDQVNFHDALKGLAINKFGAIDDGRLPSARLHDSRNPVLAFTWICGH